MSGRSLQGLLRHLHHISRPDVRGELTDAELLERFVASGDEAAYEVLLWRHGPLVLGVCRRILRRHEDVEDAFQATFLALARKASPVAKREAVRSWLYKIAYRIALDARRKSTRIAATHGRFRFAASDATDENASVELARAELHEVLDGEIQRLPAKYRDPIVLCYLQGMTQDEAARELGWPKGTVSTRLIHARQLLRQRLHIRDDGISFGALPFPAVHALPSKLITSTLATVLPLALGHTNVSASAKVVALADGVIHAMAVAKLKLTAVAVLITLGIGTGVGWLGYQSMRDGPVNDPSADLRAPGVETQVPVDGVSSPLSRLDPNRIPPEDRFDWQPRELVAVLGEHRGRHWGGVSNVVYSPDGKLIASCGGRSVRLWDSVSLREQLALPLTSDCERCLAFSADGRFLVCATQDGAIISWDLTVTPPNASELLRVADRIHLHKLTLSPDQTYIAWTNRRKEIQVWSVAKDKPAQELFSFEHGQQNVSFMAFSPDGMTLASSGNDEVILWDIGTRTPKAVLRSPDTKDVHYLAFSPDGKYLVCGSHDWQAANVPISLWALRHRDGPREIAVHRNHNGQILGLRFSPNGTMLASASNGNVRLSKIENNEFTDHFTIKTRCVHMDFSPDGKSLVLAGNEGLLRLWNLTEPTPVERVVPKGHLEAVKGFALTRDGRLLSGSDDGTIRFWEVFEKQPREKLSLPKVEKFGLYGAFGLSDDGNTLAAAGLRGNVGLWDISHHTARHTWKRPVHRGDQMSGAVSVEMSPDGRHMISSGADNKICFWDLSDSEPKLKRQIDGLGTQCVPHFAPNGSVSMVVSYGPSFGGDNPPQLHPYPTARVCDVRGNEPRVIAELQHKENIDAVAFSPDGQTVATGGGVRGRGDVSVAELRLWDLGGSGVPPKSQVLDGHAIRIYAVSFSSDGRMLVSAGADGHVILWETATRTKYREWKLPGAVYRVKFAEDGRHLITANDNGTLYVLRLGHGEKPAAHGIAVWDTLNSSDGEKVYSAVWSLVANPKAAVALLKEYLKPIQPIDTDRIERLIDRLDDDQFGEREKAQAALAAEGERIEGVLRRRSADNKLSLEAKQRVERILENSRRLDPECLRTLRAIHVLEQIGSREAYLLLVRFSKGWKDARETQAAAAAVTRLANRVALPSTQ